MQDVGWWEAGLSRIGAAMTGPYKGVRCEHDHARDKHDDAEMQVPGTYGDAPARGLLANSRIRADDDESSQSFTGHGGEARRQGRARQWRGFDSSPGIMGHSPT